MQNIDKYLAAINKKLPASDRARKTEKIQWPFPLINPDHLFSYCTWSEMLGVAIPEYFIIRKRMAEEEVRKSLDALSITIKDLYFAKGFPDDFPFSWNKVRKKFARFATIEEDFRERNDRDDELFMNLKLEGFEFGIHDYHKTACVCVDDAQGHQKLDLRQGIFPNKKVVWKTDAESFLQWIDALEDVLIGPGKVEQCRVFMDIRALLFRIRIEVLWWQADPEWARSNLRYIAKIRPRVKRDSTEAKVPIFEVTMFP